MVEKNNTDARQLHYEEITPKSINGMGMLILNIILMIGGIFSIIRGIIMLENGPGIAPGLTLLIGGALYTFLIGPIMFAGLKILKPNEALVLTLFGKYYGTLKGEGFFFVNPFVSAINPAVQSSFSAATENVSIPGKHGQPATNIPLPKSKKISLKAMTLNNDKQKINDLLGNPIIIGIVVIWRVVNTAKAVFNVDNYVEYLSIQCDSALRNIVRLYPYDISSDDNEKSLRGSSQEIADKLKEEIQSKVEIAGLEIVEARITHLAYAPEIAAAMLQRQ
ncbi:MAG TPA: SPFH domain-containing protein [Pseudomonas aeruginosa]|nr:SPFH domain-containing protein [Pseudomonas aeruginosa]